METIEQFIARGGTVKTGQLYSSVDEIPADERAEMLKRINVDEIEKHRKRAREYAARKSAIRAKKGAKA